MGSTLSHVLTVWLPVSLLNSISMPGSMAFHSPIQTSIRPFFHSINGTHKEMAVFMNEGGCWIGFTWDCVLSIANEFHERAWNILGLLVPCVLCAET